MSKISILISIYNEEKYLHDNIKSLLKQKIDKEIIFVDDFSSDNSFKIIKDYSLKFDEIKVFKNDKKGKVNAYNKAFKKSSGELICFFAGDDIMPDNSLKLRKEYLSEKYEYNVSVCKILTISKVSKFHNKLIPKDLSKGLFSGQCYLFKRNILSTIMPIPKTLPNEDTWLGIYVKFSKNFKVIHHPIIGCNYRIHDGNSIKKNIKFNDFNKKINDRNKALKFSLRYKSFFSSQNYKRILWLIELENSRYKSEFLSLIRLFKNEKIFYSNFVNSNKFTFFLKQKFWRLFTGI